MPISFLIALGQVLRTVIISRGKLYLTIPVTYPIHKECYSIIYPRPDKNAIVLWKYPLYFMRIGVKHKYWMSNTSDWSIRGLGLVALDWSIASKRFIVSRGCRTTLDTASSLNFAKTRKAIHRICLMVFQNSFENLIPLFLITLYLCESLWEENKHKMGHSVYFRRYGLLQVYF